MGFKDNCHSYPFHHWVKQSILFVLCMISILIVDAISKDHFNGTNICLVFFYLLGIILVHLLIHIHFDIKDPIKSPLHVKIICFGFTWTITVLILYASDRMGMLSLHEMQAINDSPINFLLLSTLRAIILEIIVLLWLYFLMNDHFKRELELERSNQEKYRERALNQMLRQQIQPHFLFNALSSLKSLIKKDTTMAESYLLQLSEYLRASFNTSEDGLSTVKEEIKLCSDYLSMQKVRFNEAVFYNIQVSQEVLNKKMPVFSLQPLVDNALKHNQYTVEQPLSIHIKDEEGWIIVSNNLSLCKVAKEDINNYGLRNIKERFSYYLKDSVIINSSDSIFEVRVKLFPA